MKQKFKQPLSYDLAAALPPPPQKWQQVEQDLKETLENTNNSILITDDKQCDKVWMGDGVDIIPWLHQTAELDADWQ
eukprot:4847964-Pyramimonas_sp.AAC.1